MKLKDIVYHGLGFPVIIRNCPVAKIRGAESPDVDFNKLMSAVFNLLIVKPGRLSGSQVKFIRSFLELSQVEFGRILNQKGHSIVSTWETKKAEFTGMDLNTEIILRQKMAQKSHSIEVEALLDKVNYADAIGDNPVEVILGAA
jgi:DNA-binding transcriptional regulator YiaG